MTILANSFVNLKQELNSVQAHRSFSLRRHKCTSSTTRQVCKMDMSGVVDMDIVAPKSVVNSPVKINQLMCMESGF
ncbi:hypothetical protein CPB83DRAFT_864285 [Crepidotus variabilis]|uniref:Uncharacterized protein n=1 Tax=Crepidotus variabilis TaxID=179855 RepID=A0A9P6E4R9_9AGAR|nr:hypothetical protein CPB83DRAFT_864285 [Crepidotus variabilis]